MQLNSATKLSRELMEIEGRLNEALRTIQQDCSEAEFKRYQVAFGKVMGTLFLDILEPIYAEHPSLEPPELRMGKGGIPPDQ